MPTGLLVVAALVSHAVVQVIQGLQCFLVLVMQLVVLFPHLEELVLVVFNLLVLHRKLTVVLIFQLILVNVETVNLLLFAGTHVVLQLHEVLLVCHQIFILTIIMVESHR